MAQSYGFEEEEFTTKVNGRVVMRIMRQVTPYWRWILGFVVMIALTSVADSYFTYLSKLLIDEGIVAKNTARLTQLLIQYGGLSVFQAITVFSFVYLAGVLGERVQYDMRKQLFNHLQALSFSYFDKTPVGWIMSRVTSDSGRIADLVTWGFLDITWAVLNIITSLTFMAIINWRLAIIVAIVIPIMLAVSFYFRQRILVQYRDVRKLNSMITGAYNESIAGVRVVKALVREQKNLEEFAETSRSMYHAAYRAAWLSALFLPAVQIVGAFGIGAVVWYGGLQAQAADVARTGITVGGIQAFLSYLTFILWPIQDLARVYAEMQRSVASAERVFSLIDAKPDVVDREDAFDPGFVRGEVAFEDVTFRYEEGKDVLADFNLHVDPGEHIAIVGPTGSGKTTIVNLLCRFYEPTEGVVRIDGHDYTTLTQHAIQSRIGVVLQTPHLFSGAIRDNIRYGRLDATDEEVEQAAKIAHAHDFIMGMEKGYDEDVGEGGNLLSVGQKQLVSIARAVLADPAILILDEATSSVDTLTEVSVQRGMEALMAGRTSFVIAHRLSTIKRADRILVLKAGRIVEVGTHSELIRARGHYYDLYTRQFRREREQVYGVGEFATATA
ncbi:MAG TPA: ABC transporter ATP-binding protein [Anaerolineae bacterium]|nr:ABC transporter ATP-binding protein [Anaerolineae bacterium]HQI83746.1 ABC transporter ATP-binding protein [Anaerolineae bacterium]